MEIAVVGTGYVGLTVICFADYGHKISLIGRTQSKIDDLNKGVCPIYEPGLNEILQKNMAIGRITATTDYNIVKNSDVVFICVGTPSNDDGSIDLSQIKKASAQIAEQLKQTDKYIVVVVKSTVVPSTTKDVVKPILEKVSGKECGKDFGLCMNPEFLKEGTGVEDFLRPDKIVLGSYDDSSYEVLENLYSCLDKKIPRTKTDLNTAEMIKYAQNSMLASRVSFINEIANICEKCSVDVYEVAHAIGLDSRIGPNFLKAGCGFGGSCFPKDVKALRALAVSLGMDPLVLNSVLDVNAAQPYRIIELTKEALGDFKNKKISILGLAFKPDTDDMREACSIVIINSLLEEGAIVKAYDPKAIENTKKIFGDKIQYSQSKEECVEGADACLLLTEWNEFRDLDLSKVNCPIIDGRRVLDPLKVKEHGIVYKGIGWKKN